MVVDLYMLQATRSCGMPSSFPYGLSSPEKSKNVLETVVVKPNLSVRVDPRAALVSKNILPLVGIEVRPPSSQAAMVA